MNKTIDNARRMLSLIKLLTFFINDVRIVNDRPITTISD